MRDTLHWERTRNRKGESRTDSSLHINLDRTHAYNQPQGDLYRCCTNFLFSREQTHQQGEYAGNCKEHGSQLGRCGFPTRIPVPNSLQLFDIDYIHDANCIPPFLHFNPVTQNCVTEKSTAHASSNTNSSSVLSREFLCNSASTVEMRNIYASMDNYCENQYRCKETFFSPRRGSINNIDEVI
ncbi:hypothetical protein HG535_0F03010 [Zygotorulaspora mrakii]|uniref:Uncharacterized protein n=1 Tax=Zygotorulaspora mrakii TaxID=42260 RepID=A0A7H9B5D6_ZYGMR|nr:uncharacterized protein HG535_0F03010 [Zygotorulaspora mrakii]QLG73790.1 hypothetical protein HG535_0F03010 [Zygotorulaspora mrakii]